MSKKENKDYWDELSYKDQGKLKQYYRTVIRRGLLKEKNHLLEKKWRRLCNWAVEKKVTVWDLPKKVFQEIQVELVGHCMETPL